MVDPELRVRGPAEWRMVNHPLKITIISGNTNFSAMMIGEKAIDLILNNGDN